MESEVRNSAIAVRKKSLILYQQDGSNKILTVGSACISARGLIFLVLPTINIEVINLLNM